MTTLMLLPGLMCDAAVWAPQVAALQNQAHCVVPEWGYRDSLAAMAQQVLEEAPTERFSMAGHSMGGRVALEVIRLAPQRIERLALLDTGTHALPPGEAGDRERAGRMELLRIAQEQGMRAMANQWARGMVHPERLDSPMFDVILDMLERSNPLQFMAQIKALLNRPDLAHQLQFIRCPTLILCGEDDAWSPPAQHQVMQRAIAGATLTLVKQCAHMSTLEQPAAVTEALSLWLNR